MAPRITYRYVDGNWQKQYKFYDYLGSLRFTINHTIQQINFKTYKPFGDTLWTSAGTMNRDNFDGSTYDSESDLQMLGFRMYDNETGRFTTPDLLWSTFPAQTPYHYAYNSPLTYRDPSGLAPEKEKEGEELQNLEIDWEYVQGIYNSIIYENIRLSTMHLSDAFRNRLLPAFCSGGGSRTAATYTFNGVSFRFNKPGGVIVGIDYNYTTHIPTSSGTLNVPTTIQDNAISDGESHDFVMHAFISGINDVLRADANFFNHLYGRDISVVIKHSSLIKYKGGPALGLHTTKPNGSEITLAGDILTGQYEPQYRDGPNALVRLSRDSYHIWQKFAYITHEFAHAVHWAIAGNDFNTYSFDLKEHYAVNAENRIRSYYDKPLRYNEYEFSMGFCNRIFSPSNTWNMWKNYYKRGY